MIVAFVGYIGIVVVLTLMTVRGMDDKTDVVSAHLPLLLKILVTHLAMASMIGQFGTELPTLLSKIFSSMQSSSRPNAQFAAVDWQ